MIYAMSDIHGCINELKKNMQFVDLSGDNKLIFLGDYIDGSVYKGGKLLLLACEGDKYYQIEEGKKKEIFKGGVFERSIQ